VGDQCEDFRNYLCYQHPIELRYREIVPNVHKIKRLLNSFGYSEIKTGKTSGSRVAFYSEDRRHLIRLHKPHPQNRVKRYILDYLEDELRNAGVL